MEKAYRKLIVWQRADNLAYEIYLKTQNFPREEIYGITSQMRRATLSVAINIVEGTGRQGKKELKRFISIALGSIAEVEYLLAFSLKIGYLKKDIYEKLENLRQETGNFLWRFYVSL